MGTRSEGPSSRSRTSRAALGEDFRRENRASWDWRDVVASAFVLAVVIACYVYFWNWLD